MSKSTLGPDWRDIAMAMTAVGDLHLVEVNLTISLPELGRPGLLVVKATAQPRAALDTARAPSVSRSFRLGSENQSTATAAIFRLMYELDRDCGTFWNQTTMPEA